MDSIQTYNLENLDFEIEIIRSWQETDFKKCYESIMLDWDMISVNGKSFGWETVASIQVVTGYGETLLRFHKNKAVGYIIYKGTDEEAEIIQKAIHNLYRDWPSLEEKDGTSNNEYNSQEGEKDRERIESDLQR